MMQEEEKKFIWSDRHRPKKVVHKGRGDSLKVAYTSEWTNTVSARDRISPEKGTNRCFVGYGNKAVW